MRKKDLYPDVAVLFTRTVDNNTLEVALKPVKIVRGKFSGAGLVDDQDKFYLHALYMVPGKVYGLRTNIEKLKERANTKLSLKAIYMYWKLIKASGPFQLESIGDSVIFQSVAREEVQFLDTDLEVIGVSHENFTEGESKLVSEKPIFKEFDSRELSSSLKQEVLCQDEAIDQLVTALWLNSKLKEVNQENYDKNNIILIGETGVGKTAIIRALENKLDKVVYRTNAANLSDTGYIGTSVEDILKGLLIKCNFDVELASNAIVVIDEFDKVAMGKGITVTTESVQDEMLTFLEDGEYCIQFPQNDPSSITLSTKNITFICLGAFESEKQPKQQVLGFENAVTVHNESDKITAQDLIDYGFLSELIGRVPVIIELKSLTPESLVSILNSPTGALTEYIKIVQSQGIEIEIDKEAIEEMARQAPKGIGARALKSIIFHTFQDIFMNISNHPGYYSYIKITKETVLDPKNFYWETREKSKALKREISPKRGNQKYGS